MALSTCPHNCCCKPHHAPTFTPTTPIPAQGCSSVLFFEVRKKKDLYIWMSKAPSGPSVKFHVQNGEQRRGAAQV